MNESSKHMALTMRVYIILHIKANPMTEPWKVFWPSLVSMLMLVKHCMERVIWKFSNDYHQKLIAAYNYSYTHLLITWNKQQRLHLKLEEDSYRTAPQTEVCKHYLKHLVEQLLEYGIHTFSPLPMVQLQKLFSRCYTCSNHLCHFIQEPCLLEASPFQSILC